MPQIVEVPEDASGWTTWAEYTVTGGKIFILKSVEVVSLTVVDNANINTAWRLLINNSPVFGYDNLLINTVAGINKFDCFLTIASNMTIKLQRNLENSILDTMGDLWQTRFYGNLLLDNGITPQLASVNHE